ncbi:MAG: beta-galactosidase [Phycisphaerales bacterium]|nr:beta-galactosidase [Phycisphaerales bacterium]
MASITYDGQSFQIDGRRIFLVGGTIDYARCPREQWGARILAARQAGLNTITTSVVWAKHEPRAGSFDFSGQQDLKQFVQMIGAAGMYCVLRVGPYVGAGYDLGGLPPWVLGLKDVKLRTANTAFLEASSRYISAVANQVRELQATATENGPGGPIILVQSESAWTCGDDALAPQYLGELARYLRESGFEVPITNANNLWQGLESEIDTWRGNGDMLATLRQLATVRPALPRLVSAFTLGQIEYWGGPARKKPAMNPHELQRELAEVLAAGGQFNIEPFFGGTNFGFTAGRLSGRVDAFATTSNDLSAPLEETGAIGPLYHPLRRVAMFASRFSRMLAHLEPKRAGVSLVPESVFSATNAALPSTGHVVVHAAGSQGSVAFVFGSKLPGEGVTGETPAQLLMGDGSALPVYLGKNQVTWCLFDTRLAGRSQLDYCNLSAFALVGKVFVIAGPAGAPVRLAINGSPLEAEVPMDDEPEAIEHENILVVVCRDETVEKLLVGEDGVYLGADTLAVTGEPVVNKAERVVRRFGADGTVADLKYHAPQPPRKVKVTRTVTVPPTGKGKNKKPTTQTITEEVMQEAPRSPVLLSAAVKGPAAVALGPWTAAEETDHADGSSARFASIAGPADLAALGAPYGYGWYRIKFRSGSAGSTLIATPRGGDRFHLFVDGHDAGVMGIGPGAQELGEAKLSLKKKEQTLVVLAENLGRFAGGQHFGENKGLAGSLWEVAPARGLSKATVKTDKPLSALEYRTPLFDVHSADVTDPARLGWEWNGKRKYPLLMSVKLKAGLTQRGLIVLNGKPIAFFDSGGPDRLVIQPDDMGRSANRLEIAVLASCGAPAAGLAPCVEFFDCVGDLLSEGQWAFAKWELPGEGAFKPQKGTHKGPTWYRTRFTVQSAAPAVLSMTGMSKGQVYVNGHHVGRYFTSTAKGKPVGPQTSLLIPAGFLRTGAANEIAIFDEHGFVPTKVKWSWVG